MTVQSVERALQILNAFIGETSLSLNEISQRVNLTPSTTHRLLNTLRSFGLIEQDDHHHYRLGAHLLTLSRYVPLGVDLQQAAAPEIRRLADKLQLSATLFIAHQDQAVCIEHIASRNPIQIVAAQVGMRVPLNCGAAPRVLLSYLPDADIIRLHQSQAFTRLTPYSLTELNSILRDVETTRARGYALAEADVVEEVGALGVAIEDSAGQCVGALSIVGLLSAFSDGKREGLITALQETAARITARLAEKQAYPI